MDRSTNWQRLFDEAARHGGVVTAAMARAAGIPTSTFTTRRRRESWRCLGGGTWLVPGARLTTTARRWAAVLSLGSSAVLSHGTALAIHHIDMNPRDERVHATVPHATRLTPARGVVRHRSRMLDDTDVTVVADLPVTTAARTILDTSAGASTRTITARLLTARQRDLLTISECLNQVERRRGLRGAARFRPAVRLVADDGSDSILEREVRQLLDEHGLHPATAPVPVRCRNRTLHVDLGFPEHGVAVECDGFAHHSSRRAFEVDRERWRQLREANWTTIWVTWRRLQDQPDSIVAEVRKALA